ncbi:MAG TPA: SsgA family sporulation/cell division regulator [Actinomycetes bacterium]|nr:SsgA family sporulation/cell division regulator [Actinomycetes bacterium]
MPNGSGSQSVDIVVTAVPVPAGRRSGTFVLALKLSWSDADPITVGLTVVADPPHPSLPSGTWVVLRDFLRYGLDEPTGDCAVRVRPGPDREQVTFELPRPDSGEPCRLSVSAAAVLSFLDATSAIVPSGEVSETALDALIGQLLQR